MPPCAFCFFMENCSPQAPMCSPSARSGDAYLSAALLLRVVRSVFTQYDIRDIRRARALKKPVVGGSGSLKARVAGQPMVEQERRPAPAELRGRPGDVRTGHRHGGGQALRRPDKCHRALGAKTTICPDWHRHRPSEKACSVRTRIRHTPRLSGVLWKGRRRQPGHPDMVER
ncbi:hypothetical protein OH77DRAFT_108224 [Trametes cingulata]|nr:hypothetical protein OH77DRAFT_108224 [Trametes cingulata]